MIARVSEAWNLILNFPKTMESICGSIRRSYLCLLWRGFKLPWITGPFSLFFFTNFISDMGTTNGAAAEEARISNQVAAAVRTAIENVGSKPKKHQ